MFLQGDICMYTHTHTYIYVYIYIYIYIYILFQKMPIVSLLLSKEKGIEHLM